MTSDMSDLFSFLFQKNNENNPIATPIANDISCSARSIIHTDKKNESNFVASNAKTSMTSLTPIVTEESKSEDKAFHIEECIQKAMLDDYRKPKGYCTDDELIRQIMSAKRTPYDTYRKASNLRDGLLREGI